MDSFISTLASRLDFSISNIYFKILNIQLKNDIISIPNFCQGKPNINNIPGLREEDVDLNFNKYYLNKLKNILIFRDRYLVSKANITGIIVFSLAKGNRTIFGLDDGTEVINCIMWTNDDKTKDQNLHAFMMEGNLKVGKSVTVMGQLEYYNGSIQLNIQKVKKIDDEKDELHSFYYMTIDMQKRLFDPFSRPNKNPYYRSLSCLTADNPETPELMEEINKEHSDFICYDQNIIYQEEDIMLEDEIEKSNLEKLVGLNDDLTQMIIENRAEGPLSTETIKYGFPNMLNMHDNTNEDHCYSRQIITYGESVIIQKLTCYILMNIDKILENVHKKDKKSKTHNRICYDLYRLRISNDFVNNESIQEEITQQVKLSTELKSLSYKEIIMKCIEELEKEGYIERDSNNNVESMKEDIVYFIDKRKELYDFVFNEIVNAGESGIKFQNLDSRVKENLSKFYNMEFVHVAIEYLYDRNKIMDVGNQVYRLIE